MYPGRMCQEAEREGQASPGQEAEREGQASLGQEAERAGQVSPGQEAEQAAAAALSWNMWSAPETACG